MNVTTHPDGSADPTSRVLDEDAVIAKLRSLWPIAPFVAYAAWSYARSDLRIEHLFVIAIVAALATMRPRSSIEPVAVSTCTRAPNGAS